MVSLLLADLSKTSCETWVDLPDPVLLHRTMTLLDW